MPRRSKPQAAGPSPEVLPASEMQAAVTSYGHGLTGIRLKSKKTITLTHAQAREFLGLDEFEGERPRRDAHVETLRSAMKRGTFRGERADVSVCNVGSKKYRVNGQHTCAALLKMPEDFVLEITEVVYEADGMKDMQKLYASIDRGAPRTKAHVTRAYLVGSDLGKLSAPAQAVLPAAYSLWRFPTKHGRTGVDGDALAVAMLGEHKVLVRMVGEFLDGLDNREDSHMFRAPVAAAMLATFDRIPAQAKKFWNRVADGSGFDGRNDPRRKLRDALRGLALGAGSRGAGRRKGTSSEAAYRGCLHAWNAWRKHESLKNLRFHDVGKRPDVE